MAKDFLVSIDHLYSGHLVAIYINNCIKLATDSVSNLGKNTKALIRIKKNETTSEIIYSHIIKINQKYFTDFIDALRQNTSLKTIKFIGSINSELDDGLKGALGANRTILKLESTYSSLENKTLEKFNVFMIRNNAIIKITDFIIKNFSNNKTIDFKDIKREECKFLKYYLPSNKSLIQEKLIKSNFESNYNYDSFLSEMQFGFNKIVKDISKNGGSFASLSQEINIKIFNFLEDNGVPCIGEYLT